MSEQLDNLNKQLGRLPIVPVALIYCAWVGWDFHTWSTAPESELGMRRAGVEADRTEVENLKKKFKTGEEFFKNLDTLRARIRALTTQLDGTKSSLSADVDIANFVRMVTLEAKKLGMNIKGIRPELDSKKEYYVEVPFEVQFKGAYVQILVFFDRVAKFQQVIRIADFSMKPSGSATTKYVELDTTVKVGSSRVDLQACKLEYSIVSPK